MEEIARVYAGALFDAAKAAGKLDPVREQLAQVAEAVEGNRDLQVFFFSPYFSSQEKKEGIAKMLSGAEPELVNFLELLAEKHRMPAIFRIRNRYEELWAVENRQLEVTVTSAVELDQKVVESIGSEIESKTAHKVHLTSAVDEEILGGVVLQVGNMVLDASIKNRLEKLRKHVAAAA
jgi:F-type H+-transporting ATPase subunit delta